MNIQRTRKGLTLIEIIITLGIFSLVTSTIYSLNLFGIRSFATSNERAENQFEVRMPTDFIAKKLRFANTIKILDDIPSTPTDGAHQIYLDKGELVYKEHGLPAKIIGTSNVGDYTFVVEKTLNTGNVVSFKIGKSGTDKYDLSTDVVVLNLNQIGITGDTTGEYIEFFTNRADSVTPVSIVDLVDPPTMIVNLNASIKNPSRVTAKMSDDTTRQVAARWTPSKIDTTKTGYHFSTGRVVGSNETVTLTVLVGDYSITNIDDIAIEMNKNEFFTMPEYVNASFSDGMNVFDQEVKVSNWDPILDTSTPGGPYESTGTVDKYVDDEGKSKEFRLFLTIKDSYIVDIPNVSETVYQGVSYTLPKQVVATMNDGSFSSFTIVWNPANIDTSSAGTKTSLGTVDGYGPKVTLTVEVIERKLAIESVVVQEGGKENGVVIVKGTPGATVILKNGDGVVMKNNITIGSSGEVAIANVDTRGNTKHGAKTVMLRLAGWTDSDVWNLSY